MNKHRKLPSQGSFCSLPLAGLCAASAVMIFGQSARAAAGDWTGVTGGLWGDGGNWSLAATPTSSDDLTILGPGNAPGALTINVAAAAAANSIDFTDTSAVTLNNTTSGADQTLTISAGAGAGITTGTGAVTIGSTTTGQNVNVALGASQTWDIGSGGLTAYGVISGAGSSITKIGTGTLNLQGANTFSGGLVIKSGVVAGIGGIGGTTANAAFGTGTITIGDAGTGADAGLTANAWGNNYADPIVVAAGSGARTLTSSWNNSGQIPIFTSTITLNNNLTVTSTGASGMRLNGVISEGTAGMGLIINSTSTANNRLGAANTFTGGVNIQQGTLELTNSTGAGTGTITLGNTSGTGNTRITANLSGINVTNAITVAAGNTGVSTIGNAASGTGTFSGAVALNHDLAIGVTGAGALNLSGAITGGTTATITNSGTGTGTATLSGVLGNGTGVVSVVQNSSTSGLALSNSANSFTGGIVIKNGTLTQTGDTALGSGTVTIGDGSTSNNATLAGNNGGANVSNSNAITIASGGSGTYTIADTGGRDFTLSGAIALNNAATFKTTSGGAMFLNGSITGSSAITIDGGTTTTKFVSLAANSSSTFTGNITVQNKGTLKFGIDNATGTQTAVTLDGTSTIDAGGKQMTFAGLNGVSGGTILNNGSSLTLGGGGSYNYGGALSNSGSLTKSGAGTQAFSGSITGSGAVNANAGTLVYGGATVSTTGNTNIASGATLQISNSVTEGTGANAGRIFVNSGATLTGSGTIAFSDTNAGLTGLSVTGTTTPGGNGTIGTLTFDGTNSVRAVAAFEVNSAFTFDLSGGLSSDTIALTGGQANDISFQGSNVLNFNDLSGGLLSSGDYVLFTSDVAGSYVNFNNLSIGTGLGAYGSASLIQVGNNIELSLVAVPEPSVWSELGVAILTLAIFRRRKHA